MRRHKVRRFHMRRMVVLGLSVAITALNVPAQGVAAAATLQNIVPPEMVADARTWNVFHAGPGTWNEPVTNVVYQWELCEAGTDACTPLGASTTSDKLIVSESQIGQRLRLTTTATSASGTASATTPISGPIVQPTPPTPSAAPTVLGAAVVDSDLLAVSPAWNVPPTAIGYRWQRCDETGSSCMDIVGKTNSRYVPTTSDVGFTIRVVVTADVRGAISETVPSIPTPPVIVPTAPLPALSVSATVAGSPRVGGSLSMVLQPASVAPSAQVVWLRCDISGGACSPVNGVPTATYSPSTTDVGSTLAAVGVATNAEGTVAWMSLPTAPVSELATPVPLGTPQLSGDASVGAALSVGDIAWAAGPLSGRSFSWLRCDASGGACAQIPGASGSKYVPRENDEGFTVRSLVGASNAAGSGVAVSSPSMVVRPYGTIIPAAATPPSPTPIPTIAGTPVAPAAGGSAQLTRTAAVWQAGVGTQSWWVWLRCARTGADCVLVRSSAGELVRSETLPLTSEDVGYRYVAREYRIAETASGPVSDPSVDPLASIASEATATRFPLLRGVTVLDSAPTMPIAAPGGTAQADPAPTNAPAGIPVPPAAPVTISGTPVALQTLTASNTGWSTGTTLGYQWHRCQGDDCQPIASATARTYKLGYADIGQVIRVFVTGSNAAGTATVLSSPTPQIANPPAPVNTVAPTISGTAKVDSTLTVGRGTWTNSPASYAYQWQRCDAAGANCQAISNATATAYKLVAADRGVTVRVVVTATNPGGSASATSAPSAVITNPDVPANTVAPTVVLPAGSTAPTVGVSLSRTVGTWVPAASTYTYQWERCDVAGANCVAIAAATATTYKPVVGDIGSTIRIGVTGANAGGTGTVAYSAVTAAVIPPPAPVATVAPTVTGTAAVYSTLSSTRGTWTNAPTAYAYQWQRCDASGGNCIAIAAATGASYRLTLADYQYTVRLQITATNSGGSTVAVTSVTGLVAAPPVPNNTVAPTVTGTAQVAATLTAGRGTWTNVPTSYAYEWQRCDASGANCQAIAGATTSTYKPVVADTGQTIRVVVSATNLGGTASATSGASAAVIASPKPQPASLPTITGAARVGVLLSLSEGTWVGSPTSYARRWQKCNADGTGCVTISGITASSYLIPASAAGFRIRAYVTATNAAGSTTAYSTLTEVIVVGAPPVAVTPPTLNGTAMAGETLTAGNGTWSGSPTTYTYQWQSCGADGVTCSDLAGETGASLLLGADSIGQRVRVVVRASNQFGESDLSPSAISIAVVAPPPPLPVVNPVLSGTAKVGEQLMVTSGTWDPAATAISYQWQSCLEDGTECVPIAGGASGAYTLGWGEADRIVNVRVTASNLGGSTTLTSNSTVKVKRVAPTVETLPLISGQLIPGQLVTVSQGTWGGAPTSFTYLWFACPSSGGSPDLSDCDFANDQGSVGSSIWLNASTAGKRLRVRVTAKNAIGTKIVLTEPSALVGAIEPLSNISQPTIEGSAFVSRKLQLQLGAYDGSLKNYDLTWVGCDESGACQDLKTVESVPSLDPFAAWVTATNPSSTTQAMMNLQPKPTEYVISQDVIGLRIHARVRLYGMELNEVVEISSAPTSPVTFGEESPLVVRSPRVVGMPSSGSTVQIDLGAWNLQSNLFQLKACELPENNLPFGAGNLSLLASSYGAPCGIIPLAPPEPNSLFVPSSFVGSYGVVCAEIPCDAGTVDVAIPPVVTLIEQDPSTYSSTERVASTSGLYLVLSPLSLLYSQGNGGVLPDLQSSMFVTKIDSESTPAIDGVVRVGEVIRVTGVTSEAVVSWEICEVAGELCNPIQSENERFLLVPQTAEGKRIRVRTEEHQLSGAVVVRYSDLSAIVLPPLQPVAAELPVLSGAFTVGSTVSSSLGIWNPSGDFQFSKWQRCEISNGICVDIPEAVGLEYTITSADLGNSIRSVIITSNSAGSVIAESVISPAITNPTAPSVLTTSSVPVRVLVGQRLSSVEAGWSSPTDSVTFQWERCDAAGSDCQSIVGATKSTITVDPGLLGSRIRVITTASNAGGSTTTTSNLSDAILAPTLPPVNTTPPSVIAGAHGFVVGATLRSNDGQWQQNPTWFSRDWLMCDATAECTTIGAGTSVVIPANGLGKTIQARVTAHNAAGSSSVVVSASSPTVSAPTPPSGTGPTNGIFTPATVFIVSSAFSQVPGVPPNSKFYSTAAEFLKTQPFPGTLTYEWQRCSGNEQCEAIDNQNRPEYVATDSDIGYEIRVAAHVENFSGNTVWVSNKIPVVSEPEPNFLLRPDSVVTGPAPTAYVGHPYGATVKLPLGVSFLLFAAFTGFIGAGLEETLVPGGIDDPVLLEALSHFSDLSRRTEVEWSRCTSTGCNVVATVKNAGGLSFGGAENPAIYIPVLEDVGAIMKVRARYVGTDWSAPWSDFAEFTVSSDSPPPEALPFQTVTPPSLQESSPLLGSTVIANHGAWKFFGSDVTSVRRREYWQRCDGAGTGCVEARTAFVSDNPYQTQYSAYTVKSEDTGKYLRYGERVQQGDQVSQIAWSESVLVDSRVFTTPLTQPSLPGGPYPVGMVLSPTDGSWSVPPTSLRYEWKRCYSSYRCSGYSTIATSPTYMVTAADVGSYLQVFIFAQTPDGESPLSMWATTSSAAGPVPPGPVVVTPGSISEPVVAGHFLSFTASTWDTGVSSAHVEECDAQLTACKNIGYESGQVAASTPGDVVRLVERNGSSTQISGPVNVQAGPPPSLATPPIIVGEAVEGATLSANPSVWDGPVRRTGQWMRCSNTGSDCVVIDEVQTPVAGVGTAFVQTHRLTTDDVGHKIKYVELRVTSILEFPTEVLSESSLTNSIQPAALPVLLAPPTFSSGANPPRVGYEVSVDPGQWSIPGVSNIVWERCSGSDCAQVEGTSGLSYTPQTADLGRTLRASVTWSAPSGSGHADPITTPVVAAAPFMDRGFTVVSTGASGNAAKPLAISASGQYVLYAEELSHKVNYYGNPCGASGTYPLDQSSGSLHVSNLITNQDSKTANTKALANVGYPIVGNAVNDQGGAWSRAGRVNITHSGSGLSQTTVEWPSYGTPIDVASNGVVAAVPTNWCDGRPSTPGCSLFDTSKPTSDPVSVTITQGGDRSCTPTALSDNGQVLAGGMRDPNNWYAPLSSIFVTQVPDLSSRDGLSPLYEYELQFNAESTFEVSIAGQVIDVTNSSRYAVVSVNGSGTGPLYRLDLVSGRYQAITSSSHDVFSDISEDGRFVAYTHFDGEPFVAPFGSGGSHVIVKDLQTGATIYHDESRPGDASESCVAGQFAGYNLTFSCKGPRNTTDTDGKWDVYIRPVPFRLPVCAVLGKNNWTNPRNDVSVPNANFTRSYTDITIPSPGPDLSLTRTYNSIDDRVGMFGRGWSTSWDMTAETDSFGNIGIRTSEGSCITFTPKPGGGYTSPPGMYATVTKEANGTIHLKQKDRMEYVFAADTHRLAHIVDGDQNALALTYNGAGQLAQISGARGRTLTFGYTGAHVTSVTTDPVTPGGTPLTYTYAYNGDDLASSCEPAVASTGENTCTQYQTTGNKITRIIKPHGNTDVAITYDALGRVKTRTDGVGSTDTYDYGLGAARIIDAKGHYRTVEFDSQLRVTKEFDATGHFKSYAYDANGYRSVTADELGRTTQMLFDERGNMTASKNPNGETTYYGYRDDDKIWEKDARSFTVFDARFQTDFGIDQNTGRTLWERAPQATDVGRTTKEWVYSQGGEPAYGGGAISKGLLLVERDEAGNEVRYSYDQAGDLRSITNKSGLVTEYFYDNLGRKVLERTNAADVPGGLISGTVWDERSRIRRTVEPGVTNHVTGSWHQREVETVYDENNNVLGQWERDLGPTPDAPRLSQSSYDAADRVASNTTPSGAVTTFEYDAVGNRVRVNYPDGTRRRTDYDGLDRPIAEWQENSPMDGYANPVRVQFELSHTTYDAAGQVIRTKDAEGAVTESTYDLAGRVVKKVLISYRDSAGNAAPVELERNTYLPNGLLVKKVERSSRVTEVQFDPAGRVMWTLTDPGGAGHADRRVEHHYDAVGREIRTTMSEAGRSEERRVTYDAAGNERFVTIENGSEDITTEQRYDDRGLPIVSIDPLGHWTNTTFDEAGRPWKVELPEVMAEDVGGSPVATRPTSLSGYNTYGQITQNVDPVGALTTNTYNQVGLVTDTVGQQVTQSDGSVLAPAAHIDYDVMGRPTSTVDVRGGVTNTYYDGQGQVVATVAPPAVAGGQRAVSRVEYDRLGRQRASVDARGLRVERVFDQLGRVWSSTEVVPRSDGGVDRFTSRFEHDVFDNVVRSEDALGNVSTATYDVLGRQRSATAPSVAGQPAATTRFTYDVAGRQVSVTDPLGRQQRSTFDLAGREVASEQLGADGAVLTRSTATFDVAGRQVSATSPMGNVAGAVASQYTSTYSYDALGRQVGVSRPAGPGVELTSSVGYDRAGRVTRETDGNGHSDMSGYDALGNRVVLVEPAVGGVVAQWSYVFDVSGNVTQVTDPDGTVLSRSFDGLGRLTGESASGPLVASASRSFEYDVAGQMVSVGTGQPGMGVQFGYDARGLLVSSSGVAGTASFGYDGLGRLVSRSDSAGQASFGWDGRSRLVSMSDGVSGVSRGLVWDAAGQLLRTEFSGTSGTGSGGSETYSYDGLGRLSSHELVSSAGGVSGSFGYSYDADGRVTGEQVVVAGNAAAGAYSYSYDWAGRLVGESSGGSSKVFGWDGAGNRVRAGSVTYSFDARDRLVGSSDGVSRSWSAGGLLLSDSKGSSSKVYGWDGFGSRVSDEVGGVSRGLLVDGLGRVVRDGSTVFSFSGVSMDPSSVGLSVFGRSPSGKVVSEREGTSPSVLLGSNRHGDVSWRFDGSGVLSSSSVFGPWGTVRGSTTSTAVSGFGVGFQGDVTDSGSGLVWLGARWFDSGTASFVSRDSVNVGTRFGFGSDPLGVWDPDGHAGVSVGSLGWRQAGLSQAGRFVAGLFAEERARMDRIRAGMLEVQQQLEADRVAKEQQAWSDRLVACLGGNVLVGKRAGGARYRCESMFCRRLLRWVRARFGSRSWCWGLWVRITRGWIRGSMVGRRMVRLVGVILIR